MENLPQSSSQILEMYGAFYHIDLNLVFLFCATMLQLSFQAEISGRYVIANAASMLPKRMEIIQPSFLKVRSHLPSTSKFASVFAKGFVYIRAKANPKATSLGMDAQFSNVCVNIE